MMQGIIRWFTLFVSAFFLFACAETSKTESAGEYLDSTAVTTKVKARLIDELGSGGFAIRVKTYKDEVLLSGFVNSQSIKQHAAASAARVGGVRRVRNAIVVK